MTFVAREYQLKAHELIIEAFKRKVKLLLVMSTGAGKSKTIVSFIKKYTRAYNWLLVVRKRDLVNQLAETLSEFELDFGVFMANDPRYSPKKSIQLCSIDTLDARGLLPFISDSKDMILVIDEADESNADQYKELIQKYTNRDKLTRPSHFGAADLLKPINPAFLLGMTATAFDDPLPHFDEYIEPVTPEELRDKFKTLLPYTYFIPKIINLEDVRIDKGEFRASDIERKLNNPDEIAACFQAWLRFGDNRQTLIFCINQSHAADMADYINQYYGQEMAVAVDANTSSEERKRIYKLFRLGIIRFLVNVNLITRGVDIPEIGTILDCAPTLRVNKHIQKIGRGSRPNGIYRDCIVICCANNLVNNGHFYYKRTINLKEGKKRSRKDITGEMMRVCLSCFRASDPIEFGNKNTCPYCGVFAGKVKEKKLSKAKAKALEIESASPEKIEQLKMIAEFKKSLWQFQNIGKKYPKDIAREKAHLKLIKEHGLERVIKIKNAIGLPDSLIKRQREINEYVPLGGMKL